MTTTSDKALCQTMSEDIRLCSGSTKTLYKQALPRSMCQGFPEKIKTRNTHQKKNDVGPPRCLQPDFTFGVQRST